MMCFTGCFFSLKFVTKFAFVSLSYDLSFALIISLHVITESSIIHAKYLPFLQRHIAGFQI